MKNLVLIAALSLVSSASFATDCTDVLKEYYNSIGKVVHKVTMTLDNGSRAIYQVRGNEAGGNFLDEAIVTSDTCDILDTNNIWSE